MRIRRRSIPSEPPTGDTRRVADVDALARLDSERVRAFFRENTNEIIDRMRHPADPTNSLAAVIVAKFASDHRLRAEARQAVESARTAREARAALDMALEHYSSSYVDGSRGDDILLPERDQTVGENGIA